MAIFVEVKIMFKKHSIVIGTLITVFSFLFSVVMVPSTNISAEDKTQSYEKIVEEEINLIDSFFNTFDFAKYDTKEEINSPDFTTSLNSMNSKQNVIEKEISEEDLTSIDEFTSQLAKLTRDRNKKILSGEIKSIEPEDSRFLEDNSSSGREPMVPVIDGGGGTGYDKKIITIFHYNLTTANVMRKYTDFSMINHFPTIKIFIDLVKTGGAWDLKADIGLTTKYLFNNIYQSGEYIGNHHYGYMGSAIGYGSTFLQFGAGLYQIWSNSFKINYKITTYFDQPEDNAAIKAGINLYNKGIRF